MNEKFIFGTQQLLKVIKSRKMIDKVFMKNGLVGDIIKIIKHKLTEKKIKINYVPIEKLNRITKQNHEGIIAFLSCCELHSIETILPKILNKKKDPLLLILDRITDVRNFGALVRTAECVGVDTVIIGNISNSPINYDSMRTSAGALNWIPVCKENNLVHTINYIKKTGIQIVAATEKSNQIIFNSKIKKPIALIIGNEENGIAHNLLQISDIKVKLPIYGKTKSLNVSVACGAILYEIIRQSLNSI